MLKSASKRPQPLPSAAKPGRRMVGHVVGSIVGLRGGKPLVTYVENPHGPILARSTVTLPPELSASCSRAEPPASTRTGQPVPVLLVFEGERSDRPVVVGLLK